MITEGDKIIFTEHDGLKITVEIVEINIDLEWSGRVGLRVRHSATPDKVTHLSLNNLLEWRKEAKWEIVKAQP